jgi:hypothetical protein
MAQAVWAETLLPGIQFSLLLFVGSRTKSALLQDISESGKTLTLFFTYDSFPLLLCPRDLGLSKLHLILSQALYPYECNLPGPLCGSGHDSGVDSLLRFEELLL